MSDLEIVRVPRGEACAQGAHVLRWQSPAGDDVLFVSTRSKFTAGTPIRGGVPVVFPWFGDDPEQRGRPAHGFARRLPWRRVPTAGGGGDGRLAFALADDAATRALWPHAFAARLEATFGAELRIELEIENRGAAPLRCEAALHSYFAVGDVRQIALHGLGGARYRDKIAGGPLRAQAEPLLRFAAETDRTYFATAGDCAIEDPVLRRTIRIRQQGAPSTVVWNPWLDKTARLADLGADEWPRFVCVESGCIGDDALTVPVGATHRLTVVVACTP